MTAMRQEAHQLINDLPENTVFAVVQIMRIMLPSDTDAKRNDELSKKKKAYLRMQELRRITAEANLDFDAEREAAMTEKYGMFM